MGSRVAPAGAVFRFWQGPGRGEKKVAKNVLPRVMRGLGQMSFWALKIENIGSLGSLAMAKFAKLDRCTQRHKKQRTKHAKRAYGTVADKGNKVPGPPPALRS